MSLEKRKENYESGIQIRKRKRTKRENNRKENKKKENDRKDNKKKNCFSLNLELTNIRIK